MSVSSSAQAAVAPNTSPAPRRFRWRRWLIGVAGAAAVVYGLVLTALWFGQEKLLLIPTVLPPDHRFKLDDDVREVWVDVPGARLNALHLQLPNPRGVVFFLHGNAGSLDNWFVNLDNYRRANIDLFMIDYRGYGKSTGRIQSQQQLHEDVRAAWQSIARRYEGKRRVVYGRSLGSGLAASLAAELQPELTVLVSPYTSMVALTRQYYPWVPPFVLRYPLRTDELIAGIRSPLMLMHGAKDRLIAPAHSEALLARAPHAQRVLVPDAAHNDIHRFDAYRNPLFAAIEGR